MLTVVIPTLNAAAHIDGLLKTLARDEVNVVIADGGSKDSTIEIALRYRTSIAAGATGRGTQLARGADWAVKSQDADWFLFLHADSRLGEGWALAVTLHMNKYPNEAGYFRFRADAKGWKPRLMEFCVRFRELTFGGPYGDQGLLISRALYERIGGYAEVALFEDVEIIDALQAGGDLRRLPANIYTDVSAYARDGYWARTTRNLRLLRAYRRGEDVESLTSRYRKPAT